MNMTIQHNVVKVIYRVLISMLCDRDDECDMAGVCSVYCYALIALWCASYTHVTSHVQVMMLQTL